MTPAQPHFRQPSVVDAPAIWQLVRDSGVLDVNSRYHYLLFCQHFSETMVVAELDARLVGFVTGFLLPQRPDTVFVWQVGVDAAARGHGIGRRLLEELVELPACVGVSALETTITPSNEASDALFRGFARARGADLDVQGDYFPRSLFMPDPHEAEVLYRISPLGEPANATSTVTASGAKQQ